MHTFSLTINPQLEHWTNLGVIKLVGVRQTIGGIRVDRRQTLSDQADSNVFSLVEVKSADEATRLIRRVDLEFDVPLHIFPCCELESLSTERLTFFRRVSCRSRGPDTAQNQCQCLVVFGQEESSNDVRAGALTGEEYSLES